MEEQVGSIEASKQSPQLDQQTRTRAGTLTDPVGDVGLCREFGARQCYRLHVVHGVGNRPKVGHAASAEQQQLVEGLENGRPRLVDGTDDCHVGHAQVLEDVHDLTTNQTVTSR